MSCNNFSLTREETGIFISVFVCTAICGYARQGHAVTERFTEPGRLSFTSLLGACHHASFVKGDQE